MGETTTSDGTKTPRRERVRATCCGCISLRNAIISLTSAGFIMAFTCTVLYAMRLSSYLSDMTIAEIAVTGAAMAMWLWLMGIMMLGLYGVWKENSTFVEGYFWLFITHWITDLGVIIAFLVVMYQIKSPIVRAQCAKISQGCGTQMTIALVLLTCILIAYKLFSIYVCYLIFCYRSVLLINQEDEDRSRLLRWLSRSNSNASDTSIYGKKKLWTPSRIPTIQIDFASDQSSASTYSNDSPNYREVVYGYPKVQSPPAVHYASHPAGSTINYNPGFKYDYNYTHEPSRLESQRSQLQPQLHPQPSHQDVPALPSFSVVGSSKGVLT